MCAQELNEKSQNVLSNYLERDQLVSYQHKSILLNGSLVNVVIYRLRRSPHYFSSKRLQSKPSTATRTAKMANKPKWKNDAKRKGEGKNLCYQVFDKLIELIIVNVVVALASLLSYLQFHVSMSKRIAAFEKNQAKVG